MNPNAVATPTKPRPIARTRGTVGLVMLNVKSRRMSAAIATRTPPLKLLVRAGAFGPGPPPWDDVTSDIKLPLRPPCALALPRPLRTYGGGYHTSKAAGKQPRRFIRRIAYNRDGPDT